MGVKISDLTAASSVADANEFEINESGTSKKVTASQIKSYATNATSVTAAGALMDSELADVAAVKGINQALTTSSSPTFGGMTTTGDISFGDNVKAQFGSSNDLVVFHDGNHSIIEDSGTGAIKIKVGDFRVENASGNNIIKGVGSVASLHYDGSEKLATTSIGISIASVGNIGTHTQDSNTNFFIAYDRGSSDVGLGFGHSAGTGRAYYPCRDDGSGVSDVISIGTSTYKYKDLYLSGTAYAEGLGVGTSLPAYKFHQHESSSGENYHLFTNSTTGSTSSDGFRIGIDSNENALIWHRENNSIQFATNNTERMRLTSTGLGIGTSSPARELVVSGSSQANIALQTNASGSTLTDGFQIQADGSHAYLWNYENTNILLGTNNTERMRIDSNGQVGIGATSLTRELTVKKNDQCDVSIVAATNQSAQLLFGDTDADNRGIIEYNNSSDYMGFTTAGSEKLRITQYGELIGPSNNDFDIKTGSGTGDMRFYTNGSQRARLDASGNLLVGTTSATPNPGVVLQPFGNIGIGNSNANSGASFLEFRRNATQIGGVTQSGTSGVSYNTSSDYRLKENVTDVTDGITRVKQLAPKRFNFIADPETIVDGFLAHEAQAVVPEAVTGTHNEVDDDGNAVMQGIDQSKLVPLLTAALQEAISKIETLETKVAALEGA